MTSLAQIKHQAAALVMKSLSGDATPAELRELNRLISSESALVPFVVDVIAQDSCLAWTSAKNRGGGVRRDVAATIAESLEPEFRPPAPGAKSRFFEKPPGRLLADLSPRVSPLNMALAASLLVAIGALAGSVLTWRYSNSLLAEKGVRIATIPENAQRSFAQPAWVARVVNATSCRWSPEAKMPIVNNSELRKGESLQLVEGIAEIRLEWAEGYANVRIEGPAGLILTADHGCTLSHGKLTVDVKTVTPSASFSVDTPNGHIELSDDSSAGIVVDGRDVSVHSFRGSEMTIKPWMTASDASVAVSLNEGESITLSQRIEGNMDVERGKSSAVAFASQMSMYSDALSIPQTYVDDVQSRRPLLYWRFENDLHGGSKVRNEAGERFSGTIYGSVQQRERNGNHFIEFGASSLIDSTLPRIESDDDFANEVGDEYTLEAWVKPNHFHLGTIVSFVAQEPVYGDTGLIESPHGLLLEIGGPRTTQTTIEQPGKMRYLHRSPPSGRLKGTTCFSESSYVPRKWHHLALVKQGPSMQIYLNGALAGSCEDATTLSPGLKLLVGQLDKYRSARMYVGQLDELAFYPSALSGEEIQKHYQLVRLSQPQPGAEKPAESSPSRDAI